MKCLFFNEIIVTEINLNKLGRRIFHCLQQKLPLIIKYPKSNERKLINYILQII